MKPHRPLVSRAGPNSVALETTLLCHGVPASAALPLADELDAIVRARGANPALVGLPGGRPTVGMTRDELASMLQAESVLKANAANIGIAMFRSLHAATTVGTTIELAALAGVRVFATGGIGGVHRSLPALIDISSDLAALARFPVAVVTSGVKNILDVPSTRELLETLGIPVVGFATDRFPAFYLRDGGCSVDARFDDAAELAEYLAIELVRTGRSVVVANPIPHADELDSALWEMWKAEALAHVETRGISGRDVTPAVLARLHEISQGRTLEANLALVRSNTDLAAQLAVLIARHHAQ